MKKDISFSMRETPVFIMDENIKKEDKVLSFDELEAKYSPNLFILNVEDEYIKDLESGQRYTYGLKKF
ncbi:hypothetical protein LC087_16635 [Bacillus carboniphilus]|uniref:Uncharacterized protein n=1 Tax=Bacillus carboniphilus TaxID=86663 RepID=A0ABY9JXH1_9BACI|nr:hypothetical protein [Bacillus carboniphilus]WLR42320.1 hypothetical protein LC087_16635 [Bacillus carboniphilus]